MIITSQQNAEGTSASEPTEQVREVKCVAFMQQVPFTVDAHRLGYVTGICEDYTLQQFQYTNVDVPVFVLDNDFCEANIE